MNTAISFTPFEQQASYFKALAHPVRLQILAILRQGEACVCHLEALLQKRQAYISQQLMVLREAGLLTERKDGLFVYYNLADPNLAAILDKSLVAIQAPSLEMGHSIALVPFPLPTCPCPHCRENEDHQ